MTDDLEQRDAYADQFHRLSVRLAEANKVKAVADEVTQALLEQTRDMVILDNEAIKGGVKPSIKQRDRTRMMEVTHRIARDAREEITRRIVPAAPKDTVGQPVQNQQSIVDVVAGMKLPVEIKAAKVQDLLEQLDLGQAIVLYDSILHHPQLGQEFLAKVDWYPPMELDAGAVEEIDE